MFTQDERERRCVRARLADIAAAAQPKESEREQTRRVCSTNKAAAEAQTRSHVAFAQLESCCSQSPYWQSGLINAVAMSKETLVGFGWLPLHMCTLCSTDDRQSGIWRDCIHWQATRPVTTAAFLRGFKLFQLWHLLWINFKRHCSTQHPEHHKSPVGLLLASLKQRICRCVVLPSFHHSYLFSFFSD